MIYPRKDYDRIQDPAGLIPEDEPVMLFRAQDVAAPMLLDAYAELLVDHRAEKEMVDAVRKHARLMRSWQEQNGHKVPDVDKAELR